MDALTYHLEKFDGPLDLLLSLIQKNKVEITDIPISLICDQYMEYLHAAEEMDLDLASEFIVMASELMLIKSKLLLPRVEEEEEDPRAALADALLKYQQAKQGAALLAPAYVKYSGRMVKDTDEISVDKTFVHDQDIGDLLAAVRRIVAYNNVQRTPAKENFAPMISKPIIPVEIKIMSIIKTIEKRGVASLSDLLREERSLPDLIASFLGILELIKIRKLIISEDDGEDEASNAILGAGTRLVINTDDSSIEENEYFPSVTTMAETEGM